MAIPRFLCEVRPLGVYRLPSFCKVVVLNAWLHECIDGRFPPCTKFALQVRISKNVPLFDMLARGQKWGGTQRLLALTKLRPGE